MRVTYNNAWLLIALLLASSPGIFINSASLYQTSNIYDFVGKSIRSEEHTSELQSRSDLVCRLLLEKKNDVELLPHAFSSLGFLSWWLVRFLPMCSSPSL